MNAPLYTTEILRLAASLPEPAALAREDGAAEMRSPTCGSVVRVGVMVDDASLSALSLSVQACAFGQASSAIMARHAAGVDLAAAEAAVANLAAWLDGKRENPGVWPDLTSLVPARSRRGRHGAILLPFRALAAALKAADHG
ncbi:iron-sulfur cluster assembly scaffold protein [Sphingomonas piscis]|uniref:Iron-sulfur cluster assembly scaffold protein n=1 Tax=Sphingomonas piscis TaxID=2714943 RepID=A0A6G7YMI0_9SPHN|nr:iron-sulfur cluster assembly scaffold protein [Sphingomonas piscis]QIK77948.1 iron-sulfur cluster assembly scaffold protein [Sphingomonas piscis]